VSRKTPHWGERGLPVWGESQKRLSASPRDAPTLEWEGRERVLEEGVNEGAGRRLGVPTDGVLACVPF
jgi:hypothetical protein